jgi:nucleotide-binding universal stress UspA family protein
MVTKERTMYTHILIPTDGSELAGKAVEHGIALAKRIGAKATALTVLPPFHTLTTDTRMLEDTPAQYKIRMQKHADKTLGSVAQAARAVGVACDTVHVEHEHPYQAIIDTAGSRGCDLIVMASHGRHGISAIVLGSETVKVYSRIPRSRCWFIVESRIEPWQLAIPVIGSLASTSPDHYVMRLRAFRQGLQEAGYVEGQNVVAIEYRWVEGPRAASPGDWPRAKYRDHRPWPHGIAAP